MGTKSNSDESIDPKQKTEFYYLYHQEQHTYPRAISPGHHVSKYHDNYPTVSSFDPHGSNNYQIRPGSQHPYPVGSYYDHQQTLIQEPSSTNARFNRIILILITFFVGCMCMSTLVMWFLYGTYIPEFEVSSLKISNFSVVDVSLTGNWDASFVVTNTNEDLKIDFDNVRSAILYRENIIGFSAVRSFGIRKNEKFDLSFRVTADEKGTNPVDNLIMNALDRDWRNGIVFFSMKMAMSANFSSADRGQRQQNLVVSCEYLQIDSSTVTREGRLSKDARSQCLISL